MKEKQRKEKSAKYVRAFSHWSVNSEKKSERGQRSVAYISLLESEEVCMYNQDTTKKVKALPTHFYVCVMFCRRFGDVRGRVCQSNNHF